MSDASNHELSQPSHPGRWRIAIAAVMLLAAIRVAGTWRVFSATYDESAHIAAGLEWLDRGTFIEEPKHPPLPRIFSAIGPFLDGARYRGEGDLRQVGNDMLYSGKYSRTLALARAGILPFFLLSILLVWKWSRSLFGEPAGLISAALYANLPPVLAHAGLATMDMALTATLPAAFFAFHRWLERPTPGRSVATGVLVALAMVSKMSTVLFLPGGAGAILLCALLEKRRAGILRKHFSSERWLRGAAIAAGCAVLTLWAMYRFSVGPVIAPDNPGRYDDVLRNPAIHRIAHTLGERIPVPAPEYFRGIAELLVHNEMGHNSYLFGEHKVGGWWYYFPVAIALKTPLIFLLLAILGVILSVRSAWRENWWAPLGPIAAALAILVSCMPAAINIGIRHVLPMYPLLALPTGFVIVTLWRRFAPRIDAGGSALVSLAHPDRFAVALVLAWELGTSLLAHPDYLPWFNALSRGRPETMLLDSNLDWGQDLLRLSRRVRERKIESLRLSYFGSAIPAKHKFPTLLEPNYQEPEPGWFAGSEMNIGSHHHPVTFPWLEFYRPVERIGHSIRLYYIPAAGQPDNVQPPEHRVSAPSLTSLRFLLPIAPTPPSSTDTGWVTTLELHNGGTRPLHVSASGDGLHEGGFAIAPGSSVTNPPLGIDSGSGTGTNLFVDAASAPHLRATLRTRERSQKPEDAAEIPVVPISQAAPALKLGPIRMENDARRTLRIYQVNETADPSVRVVVRTGGRVEGEKVFVLNPVAPQLLSAQISLEQTFPTIRDRDVLEVEITSESNSAALWAFISVTNNVTQKVEIVTPRR